jgi:hypothetical protein
MYGFQAEDYEISLSQWISYCRNQGMALYFSVESESGDGLLALVIAENPDLGYNHMLSVAIPAGFMEKDNLALKVKDPEESESHEDPIDWSPDDLQSNYHEYMALAAKKFAGALIVPNFDQLSLWCRENNLTFINKELMIKDKAVIALMRKEVERLNKSLGDYERVQRFELLPSDFSAEKGEVTSTMKIRRNVVQEHYKDLIEGMFQ